MFSNSHAMVSVAHRIAYSPQPLTTATQVKGTGHALTVDQATLPLTF